MTLLAQLRLTGILEAISFLLLLGICMPLKYMADIPEPTQYVGMAHGVLFILYCIYVLWAGMKYDWSIKTMFLGLLASLVPFGPFWADRKLFKEN